MTTIASSLKVSEFPPSGNSTDGDSADSLATTATSTTVAGNGRHKIRDANPRASNLNYIASCTAATLGLATAASAIAAATVASTVATVAYSILAITLAGVSIASITAWLDSDSKDMESYFNNLLKHSSLAVAASYQFVAQTLAQALVKGAADGVSTFVRRKIGGSDHTVKIET